MKSKFEKGFDFVGVTIVCFCHDGKGNFILAKRSKNTRDEHGRWDIGGGGVEWGESVESTMRRELKEEYLTDVIDYKFLGFRDVHREHDGKKTHWIALDFKVLVDPKQVGNGEPHKLEEVKWFTLDTLPKELHSQFPYFLKKYKKFLK